MPPALVIGRPNANMLAQARALGRCGIPVYCLVYRGEPAFIIKVCRYVEKVLVVRSGGEQDVAALILDVCKREQIQPVLFFGGDADISLVHRIWPQIQNHVICATEAARADYLNDKSVQVSLLKQAGVRVPDSWCISTVAEAQKYKDQYRYPIICRPVELSRRGSIVEKFYIAADWAELLSWSTSIFSTGRPNILIQEYIEGNPDKLYLALAACDEVGNVNAMVCCRKLFEYPEGLMCIGETVELPVFRELCVRAFSELHLGGVLGIEFKWDDKSKEFVFIEANLRPENILAIATAAGINLMEHAYFYALNNKAKTALHEPVKVIWKDISMVFLSRLSGKHPPRINYRGASIVDAYFSLSDPLPALAWYGVKLWRLVRKIYHRENQLT